jgi:hypothetical protein
MTLKAYFKFSKTVKSQNLEEELAKIKELVKDIPGARIYVDEKEHKDKDE